MANILRLQGNLALAKDRYKIARRLLEEAMAIYSERGDTLRAASTRSALAQIAMVQCDFKRADALLEENYAAYSASGGQDGVAYTLCLQALSLFLSRGDLAEARKRTEESLDTFKKVGNRRFVAYASNLLGEILLMQGDEESVPLRSMLEESLATYRAVGDRLGAVDAYASLALLAARQGENEAAQAALVESWNLARTIGGQETAARCLERAGVIAAAQGKPEQAVPLWGTASTMRAAIVAPMPPVYRPAYVAAVAQAREQLGDATFQSLWMQGHQTPWEQVELFAPASI
jgi:tetratricopeptide (TPR) repeat protein